MKLKKLWEKLNVDITVNQRELVLGITVCALTGILIGMILSPKKWSVIGSYNGNVKDDEKKDIFEDDEEIPFN